MPIRTYYGRLRKRYTAEDVQANVIRRMRRLDPGNPPSGGRTPPVQISRQTLAYGTGTRAFASTITTTAGDWLVVGVVAEANNATFPPTTTGVTFAQQATAPGGDGQNARVVYYTGREDPVTGGGTRTVTVTPSNGTHGWGAEVRQYRGSDGPGAAQAANSASISLTRTQDDSDVVAAVGDWGTVAPGTPTWIPAGVAGDSTVSGANVTGAFGRDADTDAAGASTYGTSAPAWSRPSVVALEVLGTTAAPAAPEAVPHMTSQYGSYF